MMRALGIALIFSVFTSTKACTTFVVGRKATADGSVMSTHSNDGGGTTDARLVKVPARDHPAGSMRPIYASPENYPRYVGAERGVEEYLSENCLAGAAQCGDFVPLGYIPQVNHTYAYFEATYGVMNEKQVGISESTCSGVYATFGADEGGQALLSIDQLSQIAMERASTAREAVQIMGQLAEAYGFYGEAFSFEGGSESLLVTDTQEGWVFHILADPTGTSAIWVGARVPDDSIAVVANMFSIRTVDLADTANYLGRADMWDLAAKQGLWVEGQPKDFTATFSDGEYSHKYYSGRRMWGIFHLFAASADLPAEYDNLKLDKPYPFAVAVDKPLTVADMAAGMRYWYEDTAYSTSQGLAGGPYGTPDRYSSNTAVQGSWERTIAIYRSSDTYIVQSRSWVPDAIGGVIWFGPAAAHATVYTPVLSSMTMSPPSLRNAFQGVYDLSQAFWTYRNLLTIAQVKFQYIIEDMRTMQQGLEADSMKLVASISNAQVGQEQLLANAIHVKDTAHSLLHYLFFTYADGDRNFWADGSFHSQSVGYPDWWLEQVGYPEGPPPAAATVMSKQIAARMADKIAKKQKAVYTGGKVQVISGKECVLACNRTEGFEKCVDKCLQ